MPRLKRAAGPSAHKPPMPQRSSQPWIGGWCETPAVRPASAGKCPPEGGRPDSRWDAAPHPSPLLWRDPLRLHRCWPTSGRERAWTHTPIAELPMLLIAGGWKEGAKNGSRLMKDRVAARTTTLSIRSSEVNYQPERTHRSSWREHKPDHLRWWSGAGSTAE